MPDDAPPVRCPSVTFTTTLRDGHCPIPFDLTPVFGRARPPVLVMINGYAYRSTPAIMGGERFVPLRRSHREAAGLAGNETLPITLTLDDAPRIVEAPADLAEALREAGAWVGWGLLSYTQQRELAEAVETAKRPETRAKRIALAVAAALKKQ